MEIGSKIKKSRADANLTQEQAADLLGVSRQTISNWENEKSYPDIISVLKMSNLYDVSLDYLLKGDIFMSKYTDYLDESTNVVRSKAKFSKVMLLLSYLVVWAISIIFFWLFISQDNGDAMGYSLMFLWIILPVITFVISVLISRNNYWGKLKWLAAIGFGIMFMLAEYATFAMANNIAFNKVNMPELSMILIGAGISLTGMMIGHLVYLKSKKLK